MHRRFESEKDRVNVALFLLLCCCIVFVSAVGQYLGIVTSSGPVLPNPNDESGCMWSIGGMAVGRGT